MSINIKKRLWTIMIMALGMSSAHATIISGNHVTTGGKNVDLGGLEWLSFDHAGLSTLGVSRADISDSNSIWSQNGWRYASYTEITALNTSLGIVRHPNINNEDGVSFILDHWDSYTQPEHTSHITWATPPHTLHKTAFDRLYGAIGSYDVSGTLIGFGWAQYISSFVDTKTFDDPITYPNTIERKYSTYFDWQTSNTDPSNPNFESLGSYLVRASQPVPEPSIFVLFGIGIIGMGWLRKKV